LPQNPAVAYLFLVRPMRRTLLAALCFLSVGCVKTDLAPLGTITRVQLDRYAPHKDLSDAANVAAIVAFVDSQRFGWTRPFVVDFGPPAPFVRADLYDGNRQIGEFTVRAGVLPGGRAAFEARYGKISAYKYVSKAEANRFLHLVGIGADRDGELR